MEIGVHKVKIVSHTIGQMGEKQAIKMNVRFSDGEETMVPIWLTDKSAGIARRSLRLCGFDVDDTSLDMLVDEPTFLRGKEVEVMVEEWNGNLRAQIVLDSSLPKKEIRRIEGLLRSVKKRVDDTPTNPISGESIAIDKLASSEEDDIPLRK